jgi:hypothetical protein
MRSLGLLYLTGVAAFALGVSPVLGQREPDAELRGDVVSAETGEPIAGAWIALEGRGFGTYSRRDGRFRLPEVPGAERRYEIAALGYLPTTLALDPRSSELVISLDPDDSLQPGLAFLLAHLEDRRNGARFFDREALAFSRAFDLREFFSTRGVRDVRKYCLDEVWEPGLEGAPPEQFYLVEIHGGTARAYSEEYLQEMATQDAATIRRVVRPEQPNC